VSFTKGGLISERYSLWLKLKMYQITILSIFSLGALRSGYFLAPFLGDLSQSEKLSEIKPPFLQHINRERA
jgi:hypothetical protein